MCKEPMFDLEFKLLKITVDERNQKMCVDLIAQNGVIGSMMSVSQKIWSKKIFYRYGHILY